MTTIIKTQCPSCETSFSLPPSQLNDSHAKARCGRCQHVFLVNHHIIADTVVNPSTTKKTSNKPTHNHSSDVTDRSSSDNFLIYDDMPIDDIQDSPALYDSSDESNAWASPLNLSSKTISQNLPLHEKPKNNGRKDTEPVHDFSNKGTKTKNTTLSKPIVKNSEFAISSSTANDVHANVTTTRAHKAGDSDNTWLEEMLENQGSTTDAMSSNNNLSSLLTSMGIPINDKDLSNQKLASDAQERLYPVQSRAQTSAASLLWATGCLVLVMLLFAQYIIFNLDTLVKNPAHATRLQAVCSIAACSLPSADINAFRIDNLEHRASQVKTAGSFSDIQATLMNPTMQPQLFPSLKVAIYSSDTVIGEFISSPEDYLLSPEKLLAAEQNKLFMFTVPIADAQINRVTISPIY